MDSTGAVAPVANEVTYLCGGEERPAFLAQNLTASQLPVIFMSSSKYHLIVAHDVLPFRMT
jgi:hypothetical protein